MDIYSRISRFDLWISRIDLGYLHAIDHSSAASHRSIARTRQNRSHLCQFVRYRRWGRPARGPSGGGPGAQGAHHWGSPPPDRQWPNIDAPAAVIRRSGCRQGAAATSLWSRDGGRTYLQETNVSCVTARKPKSVYLEHRTRKWGHCRLSAHSLMDTRGRGRPSSIP